MRQLLRLVFLLFGLFRKAIPLNVILSKEQGDASEESRRRTACKNSKNTTLNNMHFILNTFFKRYSLDIRGRVLRRDSSASPQNDKQTNSPYGIDNEA